MVLKLALKVFDLTANGDWLDTFNLYSANDLYVPLLPCAADWDVAVALFAGAAGAAVVVVGALTALLTIPLWKDCLESCENDLLNIVGAVYICVFIVI